MILRDYLYILSKFINSYHIIKYASPVIYSLIKVLNSSHFKILDIEAYTKNSLYRILEKIGPSRQLYDIILETNNISYEELKAVKSLKKIEFFNCHI